MEKNFNGLQVKTSGNSKNTPIIFIHGFPFDHSMWDKQLKTLGKKYYCISYDIRGLGQSYVGDGQYTMEAYVTDLFYIMQELSIEKSCCLRFIHGWLYRPACH